MIPLSSDSDITGVRWSRILNSAGEAIPAHALVKITGSGTDGVYTAEQPDDDGQWVWVAGIGDIDEDLVGVATSDFPIYALYDDGDGTPAVGETWGAGAGSFKLRKDNAGFRIAGDPDTDLKIVPIERDAGSGGGGGSLATDQQTIAGPFAITSDNTWLDTGLSISIPSAGTYLMFADVGALVNVSALPAGGTGFVQIKLYDSTNGVEVSGSLAHIISPQVTGRQMRGSAHPTCLHTFLGAATVKLQALRGPGSTWTQCDISASTTEILIGYVKIA